MSKKYTSFHEIDRDLKRAYLQSEIDKEELILSARQTKDSITPGKVATTVVGGVATSAVLVKLITPILSFGIGKLLRKYAK